MTVAPVSFAANILPSRSLGSGYYDTISIGAGAVPLSGAVTTAEATVAANIATLVADGASPTQAHVTTLNTNWGVYKPLADAYKAAADAATTANVSVTFDNTAVTSMNQLKSALNDILRQIAGSGLLTP